MHHLQRFGLTSGFVGFATLAGSDVELGWLSWFARLETEFLAHKDARALDSDWFGL